MGSRYTRIRKLDYCNPEHESACETRNDKCHLVLWITASYTCSKCKILTCESCEKNSTCSRCGKPYSQALDARSCHHVWNLVNIGIMVWTQDKGPRLAATRQWQSLSRHGSERRSDKHQIVSWCWPGRTWSLLAEELVEMKKDRCSHE